MGWFNFFIKSKKEELDEFDKQFGFMLKHNLTSEKSYNEVKSFYFRNL